MRQLKISKSITNRESQSIEKYLQEIGKEDLLTPEEVETIRAIGNNEGCMLLKGASKRHEGQEPRADEWPMREDLLSLAVRWGVGTGW